MTRSSSEHEQVNCPRCETIHACNVGSIDLCPCRGIQLTEDQRQYVSARFNDCLCATCLLTLKTEYTLHQAPRSIG